MGEAQAFDEVELPILVGNKREEVRYNNLLNYEQLTLNYKWLENSFKQSTVEFQQNNIFVPQQGMTVPYNDENSLDNDDIKKYLNTIDGKRIIEFSKKKNFDFKKNMFPIYDAIKINDYFSDDQSFLPKYTFENGSIIRIKIKGLTFKGKSDDALSGSISLYDYNNNSILDYGIPFWVGRDGVVKYSQTECNDAFFKAKINDKIGVYIILFHCPADAMGMKVPFASANAPLFKDQKLLTKQIEISTFNAMMNSKATDEKIDDISISITASILEKSPRPICYFWSSNPKGALFAVPKNIPDYIPTPVITLSDISLHIKNTGLPRVMIKAFMLDSEEGKQPGRHNVVNSDSHLFDGIYSSTASAIIDSKADFPDSIHFVISKEATERSFICLNIISIGDGAKSGSVLGTAAIPLFSSGQPLKSGTLNLTVFDSKSLPKDFAKKAFSPGKSFINLRVRVPKALMRTETGLADSETLIPVIGQCLAINDIQRIIDNFDRFDLEKLTIILRPWIYNYFNVKETIKNVDIFFSKCTYVLNNGLMLGATDVIKFLQSVSKFVPFLMDIIIVIVSTPKIEYSIDSLSKLMDVVAFIIAEYMKLAFDLQQTHKKEEKRSSQHVSVSTQQKRSLKINFAKSIPCKMADSFALCLRVLTHLIPFENIECMLRKYLRYLQNSICNNDEAPLFRYLQLEVISKLTYDRKFIIEATNYSHSDKLSPSLSPYSPIFSSFFRILTETFSKSLRLLTANACATLGRICIQAETLDPENRRRIATAIFPVIHLINDSFDSSSIRQIPGLQMMLIPSALFILGECSDLFEVTFKAMLPGIRKQFMTMLCHMSDTLVHPMEADPPTLAKPALAQKLFDIATQKILMCLQAISVDACAEGTRPQVIHLLSILLNEFQPTSNVDLFYAAATDIIRAIKTSRSLVAWLLGLVQMRRHSVRCLAGALLLCVFRADFGNSGGVTLSSIDTMDALTEVLLEVPPELISIYGALITQLSVCAPSFGNAQFTVLVVERMKASTVIAECVAEQRNAVMPIDVQARVLMRIADQYEQFPSVRLKWLAQIVDVNNRHDNTPCALVAQLHIVALAAAILGFGSGRAQTTHLSITQPTRRANALENKLAADDFAFMPELATETNARFDRSRQGSLLKSFDHTFLTTALQKAVELARKAGLSYTMRPLCGLLLRTHRLTRSYNNCAAAYEALSHAANSLAVAAGASVDSALSFFLVNSKDVFCVKSCPTAEFVQSLQGDSRFAGKTVGEEESNEVVVRRLREVDVPLKGCGGERPHVWNTFQYTDGLNVCVVRTKDYLPHYACSTQVVDVKKKTVSADQQISENVDQSVSLLEKISTELERWFPTPTRSAKENLFAGDMKKAARVIPNTLKIPNSTGDILLKAYSEDNSNKKIKDLARKVYDAVKRLIAAYARAANSLKGAQTAQILMLQRSVANEFAEPFGFEQIDPKDEYCGLDYLLDDEM